MPKNVMVKYVGPKKVMHVPFTNDGSFPIESWSALDDIVDFPRNQMVELSPERAELLLKQSPGVFKSEGTIRPSQVKPKVEPVNVQGDTHSALEDSGLADDHAGDGEGV